jgi:hypothetical protein
MRSGVQRHFRAQISPASWAKTGLKKFFQNGIRLLTDAPSHFIISRETGGGWLRWRLSEGKGEQTQLKAPKSRRRSYGNKESWQEQEESPCEEESRRQEEKVTTQLPFEAIH